jgi:hypothetical protein
VGLEAGQAGPEDVPADLQGFPGQVARPQALGGAQLRGERQAGRLRQASRVGGVAGERPEGLHAEEEPLRGPAGEQDCLARAGQGVTWIAFLLLPLSGLMPGLRGQRPLSGVVPALV